LETAVDDHLKACRFNRCRM